MAKVAVIYYSATGTNHTIAQAIAEAASGAGAEVRARLITETAPDEAIDSNPQWREFVDSTKDIPRATLDDLEWADAVIFGTPTRFGNVAAQLKAFLDSAGGLWFNGKLANKVYAGFTSAQNPHGGQESTLLALYNSIHHFGGFIVSPGYTDPVVFNSGGNPYGVSVTAGGEDVTQADIKHAEYLARRIVEVTDKLV